MSASSTPPADAIEALRAALGRTRQAAETYEAISVERIARASLVIRRWSNADGAAAAQVREARQELATMRDAPPVRR